MVSSEQATPRPRRRPPPRVVEVLRVQRLTPHMVRITVGGEQLDGFTTNGVAEHIRVFLPTESGELPMPVPGPDGMNFPEDQPRPTSRAYTPRRWDPATKELDIDFVIHGEGPASQWAEGVRPGDRAVISGQPGGPYRPDDVDWYVIAGDEAALPAIGTLLEALPPSLRADVYIEVLNEAEEQKLASAAQLNLTWIHRGAVHETPGRKLVAKMREVDLPAGEGRVWVSCEASFMRDIRRHFLEERGLSRGMLRTQGYWKQGALNHTDHDMGDDV